MKTRVIKCCAISDTHTYHDSIKLEPGDLLIHAGDLTYLGEPDEVFPALEWLAKQPYKHKVFIAGNHDMGFQNIERIQRFSGVTFELTPGRARAYVARAKELGLIYLENSGCTIEGLNIWGSPHQKEFNRWAFAYHDEQDAYRIFGEIPDDTDILVTHSPPRGIRDSNSQIHDTRLGSEALMKNVERVKPTFHVFGHIHEGYGVTETEDTTFINAAYCGIPYTNFNEPIYFECEIEYSENVGKI